MLLKHFFDYAQSRNLLADLALAPKAVRWIIDLDTAGDCLGVVETGDGKRGQEFPCPQTTRSKVAGGVAEFLADGITAIFGCDSEPDPKKNVQKNRRKIARKTTPLNMRISGNK